jgi:hypothetical protein|uniref:Uncharacterized protein n=1 Tax=Picea glauca TaxID=3330 RepID=A0A101M4S1_PICGL|nr:hypothetical protein ABT39_MTgene922 [Picea glauca]QHR91000.1 hypothetical protein Q903MT_gene5032 [Picea sitchensis]
MLLLKRRRDQPDLELGNEFNLQLVKPLTKVLCPVRPLLLLSFPLLSMPLFVMNLHLELDDLQLDLPLDHKPGM